MEKSHMPTITATSGSVDIPDGVYPATLLSLTPTPATANSPNTDPFFKWTLHVYNDTEGVEMTATSSMRFSPKSKARVWVESVLDRRFETGEDFDYEAFCPRDCQVVVKKNENGFCRIEAIMGVPKRPTGRVGGSPSVGPSGITV
jgi:hypothetical protein